MGACSLRGCSDTHPRTPSPLALLHQGQQSRYRQSTGLISHPALPAQSKVAACGQRYLAPLRGSIPCSPPSTQEKLLTFTCPSPGPAPSPDTHAPTDSTAIFGTGPCWHKPLPEISNVLPITHVEKTNIREYLTDKPTREPSTRASLHTRGSEHQI